jgi:hypothetical protein
MIHCTQIIGPVMGGEETEALDAQKCGNVGKLNEIVTTVRRNQGHAVKYTDWG